MCVKISLAAFRKNKCGDLSIDIIDIIRKRCGFALEGKYSFFYCIPYTRLSEVVLISRKTISVTIFSGHKLTGQFGIAASL